MPWGGGDEVCHSSVVPPQGSAEARAPRSHATRILRRATKKARPSTNAHSEIQGLMSSRYGRETETRRFMPCTPAMNTGKKVEVKARKGTQAASFPTDSRYKR